jgi:putative tricarboxylic transport membrane protein
MASFVIGTALSLGLGTSRSPAPGYVPFVTGVLFLALSLLLLAVAIFARKREARFNEFPLFRLNVLINCVVLFGYSLSLEFLGFLIGTTLLLLYLFRFPGAKTWRFSIVTSAIVVGFSYYFFGVLLQVPLPQGIMGIG